MYSSMSKKSVKSCFVKVSVCLFMFRVRVHQIKCRHLVQVLVGFMNQSETGLCLEEFGIVTRRRQLYAES